MLRLNGLLRSGEWATVNPSIFSLLKQSKKYFKTSNGFYDPAKSGLLINLWDMEDKTLSSPPEKNAYQAISNNAATMNDVELKGVRARSANTEINLDFGTLLHGYTVDMVFDYLVSEGAKDIVIRHGNTVRISTKKDVPHIEKIDPLYSKQKKMGAVTVAMKNGEALCVSRLKGDNFRLGGRRYSTIFNPKTGKPADQTGSVIVVHQNAMDASATCQSLFIAGPDQWREIDKSMSAIASLYVATTGKLEMTMPMLQRVETDKQKNLDETSHIQGN